MSDKIRIAFIINSLGFGGVEKGTVTRFNNLPTNVYHKALVYLKKEEPLLTQIQSENGIVWCPQFKKGWDFSGLWRLSLWMQKFQPDAILCVNTYPMFVGHLARLLSASKAKLFVSFHSTAVTGKTAYLMRYVYPFFFNRSDRIIYVSSTQRAYWEGRGLRRDIATVIHNGVDTEHFTNHYSPNDRIAIRNRFGFDSSDFVVGICAALRPEKRHQDLIEGIARLKAEGIPAKCLIIGDGACRCTIEKVILHRGLERDVVITGFQTDVRPLVAVCDCMAIVSSSVETFSNAALESMAMCKPMVMSTVGGAAEQVHDGQNGYLFPPGDVVALTGALRKLADPAHCARLGSAARAIVERHFGLDVMLEKYSDLFGAKLGSAAPV